MNRLMPIDSSVAKRRLVLSSQNCKKVSELLVHGRLAQRWIKSHPNGIQIVLHHLRQHQQPFDHLFRVGAGDSYLAGIESHARGKVLKGHAPEVIRQAEAKCTGPRHRFCALMF